VDYLIFLGVGAHDFQYKTSDFSTQKCWRGICMKVLVAGLLSKLDTGAPYNRGTLGGGLWFDSEEEAEKIPMGFDSEKSFTEMKED
jgi:hypothetical protein